LHERSREALLETEQKNINLIEHEKIEYNMGSLISHLWWGGQDPDAVDPKSGLSPRDLYNVKKSWKKFSADGVASGTEMFLRYFTAHPQSKTFFKMFKDMPNDELRTNIQFNAHALNVINSLTAIIDKLEVPELAAAMSKKLGVTHQPRKLTEAHFNNLKDVLVKLFIDDFKFDEETMKSWVKVVTFIYANIFSELNKNQD